MAPNNPFSPTFGTSPPALAGRDEILHDLDEAYATGPTHPDFTVLFIGVRGAGKTAMLNAAEDMVRERGWLVIAEQGSPEGLIQRLAGRAVTLLASLVGEPTRHVRSVQAAGFGVSFEPHATTEHPYELRAALTELGDRLRAACTGLLITIDELHSADLGEVREFGAILQHVTRREGRPVAFAGAALPHMEDELLEGQAATFLQRCSRYDIGLLDKSAARDALATPIKRSAATIEAQALDRAVEASNGYAFMVQLVGFYTWKAAHDPSEGISDTDVTDGIDMAERRIGRLVIAPTWNDLSDTDRRFLIAMTADTGASALAAIAQRMGVSNSYAHVYRRRLERAGMVVTSDKRTVTFAYPTAKTWITSKAADLPTQQPAP